MSAQAQGRSFPNRSSLTINVADEKLRPSLSAIA